MTYKPLKGLEKVRELKGDYVGLWALERLIGVLSSAPKWVLGSIIGQMDYVAWLGFAVDKFQVAAADIMAIGDPNERMRRMKELLKEWGAQFRRLSPDEVAAYRAKGETLLATASAKLREQVEAVRRLVTLAAAASPAA